MCTDCLIEISLTLLLILLHVLGWTNYTYIMFTGTWSLLT